MNQNVPGSTRMYQNVPGSTRYQNVPRCTRMYQDVPGSTRMYQDVPECTKMYQKVPGSTRKYQDVPECTRKYQEVPECTRMYQNVPGCTRFVSACTRIDQNHKISVRIVKDFFFSLKFILLSSCYFILLFGRWHLIFTPFFRVAGNAVPESLKVQLRGINFILLLSAHSPFN